MGFFEMFGIGKQSSSNKKVIDLEQKVRHLEIELANAHAKINELSGLVSYSINAQKQLSLDMNIIYESITAVSETLQAPASAADDDRYFKWRWNVGDDDDDLPN